ncbi:hypothetical protein BKD09_02680 [Bradyrhizobium japonicum]|uniref:Uncharacterized protein n=1 Tax=Bradyrhizobium japonicum TaxID=375 RepID=A0A1L3F1R6_BRAJP|nr:hypothetical protein BKD09_02680 [Bradyrhizobium japonicum]
MTMWRQVRATLSVVMLGLVPGIHVLLRCGAWMAGTSPVMTVTSSSRLQKGNARAELTHVAAVGFPAHIMLVAAALPRLHRFW